MNHMAEHGYYKFFVSEEAKNDLLEYAPIAKRKCDTPEIVVFGDKMSALGNDLT